MKIKRVLLMVPPAFSSKRARDVNPLPPLGLGYLAAVLENLDIEVKIFDSLVQGWDQEQEVDEERVRIGLPDREIKDYLLDFNPDLIGLNCQFSVQYRIYHHILGLIKQVKPQCLTVAGGAHATACPDEVLADPACDFVVQGEGEVVLKELILALVQETDPGILDGLGWKRNGTGHINEKLKWITNLDSIAFPAYHLMHLDSYYGIPLSHGTRHRKKFCPIVTSRGCLAKCTFCTAKKVWGNKYRMRSVDNVLNEMRLLHDQYGIEEIMFEDDNVTANPKRAKDLFSRMIQEKFDFVWDTPNGVGVWSIDREMIDLMKESGCLKLNFPLESGSQEVLDQIIKKPVKLSKARQLIEYCRKINLNYNIYLVIGMPGEKIADMWKSFQFAADSGCYAPHISVATPYPGSQLFEDCLKKGYFAKEFTLDDLYIRSFLIQTEDWGAAELRRTLIQGQLYLRLRMLLADPRGFLEWLGQRIKNPSSIIRYLRNVFLSLRTD